MGTIYIIAGIIYLIVTIVVVVKICQTANNTAEIKDLLAQIKNSKQPNSVPNESAKDEDDNKKTLQKEQEQEAEQHREKTLYEQQQEYWQ